MAPPRLSRQYRRHPHLRLHRGKLRFCGDSSGGRLVDALIPKSSQRGQTFHATLDSHAGGGGQVAIPRELRRRRPSGGSEERRRGRGQSVVALVGSHFDWRQVHSLQTDQYRRQGSSRGRTQPRRSDRRRHRGYHRRDWAEQRSCDRRNRRRPGRRCAGSPGSANQAALGTVLNFTLQAPLTVVEAKVRSWRHPLDGSQSDPSRDRTIGPQPLVLNRPDSGSPDPNQ
jgi:hypothetical protein